MLRKYFRYLLLGIFLLAILLIVFLQFNSNRSIGQFINSNESLMGELRLKNELQQLQTAIVTVESRVKGAVILNEVSQLKNLQLEVAGITTSLNAVDSMINDKATDPLVTRMQDLVKEKIQFNYSVLDTFSAKGKTAAEKLINEQSGMHIIDSIRQVSMRIDELRQETVTHLTKQADADGARAKTLGSILALMAALAALFAFGYVSNRVRQQGQMIDQLNESEKKAREAARIKENFLANMSHEIRTPMNAILGFTNLLQRKNLDAESREYVQTIKKSGENLLTIINDILDLSKIEAGMMRIESAPFSIRGLVHSVESIFIAKLAEKKLQLSSSIDPSLPDILEGDAFRLTQILVNLVGNAIKFTNKGYISMKITNEGQHGNTINTGIAIIDSGIGIEKEKLKNIFERFQQAEDSVTRKYGGTGLGLSIVHNLVMLQEGTIDVTSEPGKGTTFRLVIPYRIAAEQFNKSFHISKSEVAEADFAEINVLVVEDNEINQNLIKHLFNRWHIKSEFAYNGKEAIELLQKKKYDLILMDIQMPEMDGYTAAEEIRTRLKSSVPIIAMTAHAFAGEKEKCLSYGMNEYISKPIREEQLHQLITRFALVNKNVIAEKEQAGKNTGNGYRFIDLKYMKEVSGGNIDYEKTVTEQFTEAIPDDLKAMEDAWRNNDISNLRQLAHNMKTTVSVMGLNEVLSPYLDALEFENINETTFRKNFLYVKQICDESVKEAKHFQTTL